jgi:hypothetical protein
MMRYRLQLCQYFHAHVMLQIREKRVYCCPAWIYVPYNSGTTRRALSRSRREAACDALSQRQLPRDFNRSEMDKQHEFNRPKYSQLLA